MLPEIAPVPALAASLLATFGGLALLAQGIEQHHREVWGVPPPPWGAPLWRLGGALVLVAAYGMAVMGFGLSIGLVVWLGLTSLALPALAFGLPFAPRRLRPLLLAAPLIGAAIAAAAL